MNRPTDNKEALVSLVILILITICPPLSIIFLLIFLLS